MSHIDDTRRLVATIEKAVRLGEISPAHADRFLVRYRAEVAEADRLELADAARLTAAGVVRHGTIETDDGGLTQWYLIDRTADRASLRTLGVPFAEVRCHSGDWDCCGRLGTRGATIRRTSARVLVTVAWYRDV